MTFYDDPNRQAVGLEPIWSGAEGEPPPEGDGGAGVYDPGQYTVDQVNAYVEAHPEERDAVLDAEAAGKARAGILG